MELFVISAVLSRNVATDSQQEPDNGRTKRDLVFENMVMRTHNSTTRKENAKPVVGGGILERKIIIASNGTQRTHHESRGNAWRKMEILMYFVRDGVLSSCDGDRR